MVKDVATVEADTPVEDAARLMADRNIGCLPVMDGPRVVGMVNQNDIFRCFMELLGGRRKGVRVWASTVDEKGTIARITTGIAAASGDIVGFGFNQISDPRGVRWEITLKVQDIAKDKLVQVLKPCVLEILDVRET
jgi:acetoin utilization protein AcuB